MLVMMALNVCVVLISPGQLIIQFLVSCGVLAALFLLLLFLKPVSSYNKLCLGLIAFGCLGTLILAGTVLLVAIIQGQSTCFGAVVVSTPASDQIVQRAINYHQSLLLLQHISMVTDVITGLFVIIGVAIITIDVIRKIKSAKYEKAELHQQ